MLVVLLYMVGFPGWFIFVLWNFCSLQGKTGRTIGKRIVNISTVNEASGQPLGGADTFLREVLHLLDLLSIVGLPLAVMGRQATDVLRQDLSDRRDRRRAPARAAASDAVSVAGR